MSREMGDTIIVAQKPIDRYLLTAMRLLKQNRNKMVIEARGSQNIAKAITVSNILRRQEGMTIKNVEIGDNTYTDTKGVERVGVEAKILLMKE